jgi:mannose-6-phosphate isomerase-like protein (cupin superfamily)
MKFFNIDDIEGTEFPAGRRTRVLVGENAPIRAEHFQIGRVTIYPGGKVPKHNHFNEEVYVALEGTGQITVGDETKPFPAGSYVYIPTDEAHVLENPGDTDFTFMFIYAPADTVDHWGQELEGTLK